MGRFHILKKMENPGNLGNKVISKLSFQKKIRTIKIILETLVALDVKPW